MYIGIIGGTLYGVGIGFIMTVILFQSIMLNKTIVKEISPSEMVSSTLSLFAPALLLGNLLVFVIKLYVFKHKLKKDSKLVVIPFLIPAILSFIQLMLLIIFFRNETPVRLYKDNKKNACRNELAKIYNTPEASNKAYKALESYWGLPDVEYPSYAELLSPILLKRTLKGISVTVLRALSGVFVQIVMSSLANENGNGNGDSLSPYFDNLLILIALIGTFITFFLLNCTLPYSS